MKARFLFLWLFAIIVCYGSTSCSLLNRLFPVKRGCPSNGKNVGAERLLTGEKKLPKAKKFKA